MYQFPKAEHLCSKKIIETIFSEGKSFSVYPFRFVWLPSSDTVISIKLAISVPKKHFKRAVHRNLLKRRIRECYRLQKVELYSKMKQEKNSISLFLIYTGRRIENFQFLFEKMTIALKKLENEIFQNTITENTAN